MDAPEVVVLTADEWDAAVRAALGRLGLTYDELADMARRGDFVSIEAKKLWITIGGSRSAVHAARGVAPELP